MAMEGKDYMNSNVELEIYKRLSYKPKVKKRKIQPVRTLIQALVTFILSYGAYVVGESTGAVVPVFQCVYVPEKTANGICKALTKSGSILTNLDTSTAIAWGVMLGSLLVLGKIWCGYLCPFGFFQDILTIIRKKLKIAPIRMPEEGKPLVKLLKWGILICLMFGIGFCRLCPVKYIMQPLSGAFPGFNIWGLIIAGVVVGICFMKESAFCELCPLGILMGLFYKVAGPRIKKNGSACTHCRACLEVCPMGIEGVYQLRNKPDVTHSDCIFCMKCIDACPEKGALSVSLLGKTILTSERRIVKDGNKN